MNILYDLKFNYLVIYFYRKSKSKTYTVLSSSAAVKIHTMSMIVWQNPHCVNVNVCPKPTLREIKWFCVNVNGNDSVIRRFASSCNYFNH